LSGAALSADPSATSVSQCSPDPISVSSEGFSGGIWTLASQERVSTSGTVDVQADADVAFVAPSIVLRPGFAVSTGARFAAHASTVTCPSTDVITQLELQTGAAGNTLSVTTAAPLQASAGDLYLAAIASKPWREVTSVEGLGLSWFPIRAQCSGREATGVTVWGAMGVPISGPVTASFEREPENSVISVSRLSGVDADDPIGAVGSSNTVGYSGDCDGGIDSSSYSFDLDTIDYGSLVFAVAAMRNRTHTPAAGWTERIETVTGGGGDVASLAAQDAIIASPQTTTVAGSFDGEVDWAVVAVELRLSNLLAPRPSIVVDPTSRDFGPNLIGTHRTLTFEVSNQGAADLEIAALRLTGQDTSLFSIESDPAPPRLAPGDSTKIDILFVPEEDGAASAALEIDSNDPDLPRLSLALSGNGMLAANGIWTSAEELATRATIGPAWEALEAAAEGNLGTPNVGSLEVDHNALTLAVALAYARTGDTYYWHKARDAIESAIGTEASATETLPICRSLAPYVFAADLLDLATFDPAFDGLFRDWIDAMRYLTWPETSMIDEDEERANNYGRACGMSRAAIAIYLGDHVELERAAEVFAGYLGDTSKYDGFLWKRDLSWQADEARPVGVNPVGAIKDSFSIDGALPDDMRRGGLFQIPPVPTNYPWTALQGVLVEAVILARAGYDVFEWSDRAILRALRFLEQLDAQFPGNDWWATGDDTWIPWIVNQFYGPIFPTEPAEIGKFMGWTDWTHSP
jgi:hypothetical protein